MKKLILKNKKTGKKYTVGKKKMPKINPGRKPRYA